MTSQGTGQTAAPPSVQGCSSGKGARCPRIRPADLGRGGSARCTGARSARTPRPQTACANAPTGGSMTGRHACADPGAGNPAHPRLPAICRRFTRPSGGPRGGNPAGAARIASMGRADGLRSHGARRRLAQGSRHRRIRFAAGGAAWTVQGCPPSPRPAAGCE